MSDEQETNIPLDELEVPQRSLEEEDTQSPQSAADLEAVFDVPVRISAVLGHSKMHVSDLLKLASGTVLELDRKVGEAIDIYVNDRLVARGEVVLVEDKLGVTMTEIIKTDR
ncbi:MAG: flagellar motor switch protein FliN [Roseibium sp.]|uniref:flagellar motor switch protein FliN n=1 Tax=Roseibium sp. TaxID=1936156 RepID=UPI001B1839F7|nr:flagellar motor switch protein FliN [Roseibium sp.]MBO6507049.1 flagellar motor switch protein FliN [Roseibium sp.]MBO6894645.1 flagellar motor switch protein FliN [Roseibium sp.]MBO6928652.1 flagellar motor switch protein FliN [Roseibium sp.]